MLLLIIAILLFLLVGGMFLKLLSGFLNAVISVTFKSLRVVALGALWVLTHVYRALTVLVVKLVQATPGAACAVWYALVYGVEWLIERYVAVERRLRRA